MRGETTGIFRCVRLLVLCASSTAQQAAGSRAITSKYEAELNSQSTLDVVEPQFTVWHYNILAKYMGDNYLPWYLYPLNLTDDRRQQIMDNFYARDRKKNWDQQWSTGFGWVLNYVEMLNVQSHYDDFAWDTRGEKVIRLITSIDTDIISLVELDNDIYPQVKAKLPGYESIFFKRPRATSLDGCGLFWKVARFEAINEPLMVTLKDWARGGKKSRVDRVVLAQSLRDTQTKKIVVAASMHMMRNPEDPGSDPQRMLQVSQMMNRLSHYVSSTAAHVLILLADMNALPDSWTYVFMKKGWHDCPESQKNMMDATEQLHSCGKNCKVEVCTSKTTIRHSWIDYVFFSAASLELLGIDVEACPERPIPDATHPSDHLPLKATFRFARPNVPVLHPCFTDAPRSLLELKALGGIDSNDFDISGSNASGAAG